MNNLVEGVHGHGAIETPKSPAIPNFAEVAKDTAPFDWTKTYDVRTLLSEKAGISDLPTKDQNGSYSCGGQLGSYLAEAIIAILTGTFDEKSAKFLYAPIAQPGGGSTEFDIINRLLHVGISSEKLCPSYENGKPPSEAFMTRVSDITPEAIQDALKARGYQAVYIDTYSLDDIACAIRDHYVAGIGVRGQNNGSWLSKFPVPPSVPLNDPSLWGHWLMVGFAGLIENLKRIGHKNSWGDSVGERGWQYLGEDYLPYIFTAFTVVYLGKTPGFTHAFNANLQYGQSGPEVGALQMALKIDGEFPESQAITNYFGPVTLQAVKDFQAKYAADILAPLGIKNPTGVVGGMTRRKLNALFSN